jgi:hypothetical protein
VLYCALLSFTVLYCALLSDTVHFSITPISATIGQVIYKSVDGLKHFYVSCYVGPYLPRARNKKCDYGIMTLLLLLLLLQVFTIQSQTVKKV